MKEALDLGCAIQLVQLRQNLLGVWYALGVHPLEPYHALFVYYDHRPPGGAPLLVVDVVELRHPTLGMEIRQYGIGNTSHTVCKSLLHCGAIHAHAQNLGILLLEPAVRLPEPGALAGSTPGKGQDVGMKYHPLFPQVLAQGYLIPRLGAEGKVRRLVSYFRWHVHLLECLSTIIHGKVGFAVLTAQVVCTRLPVYQTVPEAM